MFHGATQTNPYQSHVVWQGFSNTASGWAGLLFSQSESENAENVSIWWRHQADCEQSNLWPISITIIFITYKNNGTEISVGSPFYINQVIATIFYKWPDNFAVVTDAKYCCDRMASYWITLMKVSIGFQLWANVWWNGLQDWYINIEPHWIT